MHIVKARKTGAAQVSSASQVSPVGSASVFDAANKVLGQSGQRIESLGSDSLARWMQENGVEE
jgi:hypothetical protein